MAEAQFAPDLALALAGRHGVSQEDGSVPKPVARRSTESDARLREIVLCHFDFIWRSLRRLGVPSTDVDDCAQQVFWVAARKIDTILEGSERSFLFGTALRVAADNRRTRQRRREVPEDEHHEPGDPAPRPDELTEQHRARALLDQVLAGLPLELRTVFVLFELEELPTQDIAKLLGIPMGTVASRLRRAREEFHQQVNRMKHKLERRRGALEATRSPVPSRHGAKGAKP